MNHTSEPLIRLASRVDQIEPFYVMELMKDAQALERAGRDVIHMSIGEPDFTAPEPVTRAAADTLTRGVTQYTNALGITPLREAITRHYHDSFGLTIELERVVTAGTSAALLLACMALIDHGDEVLMPDPCYPCNRHFVSAADGKPVLIPSGPDERFQADGGARRGALGRENARRTARAAYCWHRLRIRPARRSNRRNCIASSNVCGHAATSPSSMRSIRA